MADNKKPSAMVFWIVTALVLSVLSFVLIQLNRFWMAIHLSDFIDNRAISVSTEYLAVSGLLWAAIGILTVWWLLRRKTIGLRSLKLITVCYTLNYWIEQIWFADSSLRSLNWIFSAGMNLIFLLLILIILSLSFVRKIFGEHNGRKP
jgi:hypothetical protein